MLLSQSTECVKRQYLPYLAAGAETQWRLILLITLFLIPVNLFS